MSERTDLACTSCDVDAGRRCHPDCRNHEDDDELETAEEVALGHRVAYLEAELERIRPVYEAACEQVDEHAPISTARLRAAVDAARSPR